MIITYPRPPCLLSGDLGTILQPWRNDRGRCPQERQGKTWCCPHAIGGAKEWLGAPALPLHWPFPKLLWMSLLPSGHCPAGCFIFAICVEALPFSLINTMAPFVNLRFGEKHEVSESSSGERLFWQGWPNSLRIWACFLLSISPNTVGPGCGSQETWWFSEHTLGPVSQLLSIGYHEVPGAEQQFGKEVVTKWNSNYAVIHNSGLYGYLIHTLSVWIRTDKLYASFIIRNFKVIMRKALLIMICYLYFSAY